MPKLEAYHRDLPYSYAPGIFPATECLRACPDRCLRLLVHSRAGESEGVGRLAEACEAAGIRVEQADRALERIVRKENCYAAMVFAKREADLDAAAAHVVLHRPADAGNAGAVLRTCLALGVEQVAILRPAVDIYEPRAVRASMGAMLRVNVRHFDDFDGYRAAFPGHALYPFMLAGSVPVETAAREARAPYALVFGNEASGLPDAFAGYGQSVRIPQSDKVDSLNLAAAAAIGVYAFQRRARSAMIGKEEV
ncbi:MAG: TrmH family RNA methyltransferase [Clostridia bacterium]|nr:TrmH family RNA methyltransferase [Clostridia bacterium]